MHAVTTMYSLAFSAAYRSMVGCHKIRDLKPVCTEEVREQDSQPNPSTATCIQSLGNPACHHTEDAARLDNPMGVVLHVSTSFSYYYGRGRHLPWSIAKHRGRYASHDTFLNVITVVWNNSEENKIIVLIGGFAFIIFITLQHGAIQ